VKTDSQLPRRPSKVPKLKESSAFGKTVITRSSLQTEELPDGLKVFGPCHLCNACAGKLKNWIQDAELYFVMCRDLV
jgi:hypothetical protein